jgi:hypothetical protein
LTLINDCFSQDSNLIDALFSINTKKNVKGMWNIEHVFNGFSCLISGLFHKTYSGASDESCLTDKAVIYSVGSDDFEAKTNSHCINYGMNGSTSSLYYRNVILDAFDDEYGGVLIDPNRLPHNTYAFASLLCLSLSHWKKKVKSSLYVDYYPCDA